MKIIFAFAWGVALSLIPAAASASTWTLDVSNGCSGSALCATGPFGTVDVTNTITNRLDFVVSLNSSKYGFLGATNVIGFNLSGAPAVTFSAFNPSTDPPDWSGTGPASPGDNLNGMGRFQYIVGNGENGAKAETGSSVEFSVSGAGLNLGSIIRNSKNYFFAVHLYCLASVCGNNPETGSPYTGWVGTIRNSQGQLPIPIPTALPLFGTGLALMGFVGWRRKRAAAA